MNVGFSGGSHGEGGPSPLVLFRERHFAFFLFLLFLWFDPKLHRIGSCDPSNERRIEGISNKSKTQLSNIKDNYDQLTQFLS